MMQNNKNAPLPEHIKLAKISIPHKEKWIPRERLFKKLRSACQHKAVWVAAPSGSGKTVLLSSYLCSQKIPCIWYNIDKGDEDIASFFNYMSQASEKVAPHNKKALPVLTSEDKSDLQSFTRLFFRDIFSRIKLPGIMVLDNYQDVPSESPLHDILNWAVSECPQKVTLIILGCCEPPPQIARLQLNNDITCIDWNDLRLTREETRDIAHLHNRSELTAAQLETLYEQTHGWIAGLTLLLNQTEAGKSMPDTIQSALQPEIFDYFIHHVLEHMSVDEYQFLLDTSFLPYMTAPLAEDLTNNPKSSQILKQLVDKHHFTYRSRGSITHYEYHPLFHQFLETAARKQLTSDQFLKIQKNVVKLLMQHKQAAKPTTILSHNKNCRQKIKFHTLNRFGIIKDGEPVRPSRKVQQFLKALIALGGRDIQEETLSNALWPDAEGDAAHQSFSTTLHRARKIIGNDVLQLRQNQVSLNPLYCWIDIWDLKRTLNEIEQAIVNSKETLPTLIEHAISLYHGPFLGADENETWMLSTREQLSNKFLRTLTNVADSFCLTKECSHALGCYQKGLEIDDLSEKLYQGLMHCHNCTGNQAEGLAVYQRCRERLKTTFDIEPSAETERLHIALKNS